MCKHTPLLLSSPWVLVVSLPAAGCMTTAWIICMMIIWSMQRISSVFPDGTPGLWTVATFFRHMPRSQSVSVFFCIITASIPARLQLKETVKPLHAGYCLFSAFRPFYESIHRVSRMQFHRPRARTLARACLGWCWTLTHPHCYTRYNPVYLIRNRFVYIIRNLKPAV